MRELFERVPQNVLDELPPLIIFAPSQAVLGEMKQKLAGAGYVFLYLSPQLEDKSQKEVNFIVAHEFAHVVLGHYQPGNKDTIRPVAGTHDDAPSEIAADKLAESWGFDRSMTDTIRAAI